nr:MAG TPA: hypothetical protein [Caudoviricetes sp.]
MQKKYFNFLIEASSSIPSPVSGLWQVPVTYNSTIS